MLNQDNNLSARSSEQAWLLVQLPAQLGPHACQNTPVTSQRIHKKGNCAQNAQQDTLQPVLGSPGKLNDPGVSSSVCKHRVLPAPVPGMQAAPRARAAPAGLAVLRSPSQPAGNASLQPPEG